MYSSMLCPCQLLHLLSHFPALYPQATQSRAELGPVRSQACAQVLVHDHGRQLCAGHDTLKVSSGRKDIAHHCEREVVEDGNVPRVERLERQSRGGGHVSLGAGAGGGGACVLCGSDEWGVGSGELGELCEASLCGGVSYELVVACCCETRHGCVR